MKVATAKKTAELSADSEKKKTSANPGVQRQDWSIDPQALAFKEKCDKKVALSGREMRSIIDPNANMSACCLVNCRRQLGTRTWHLRQGEPRRTVVNEYFNKCPDLSVPYTLTFYRDKIVCDQCWQLGIVRYIRTGILCRVMWYRMALGSGTALLHSRAALLGGWDGSAGFISLAHRTSRRWRACLGA